jgi:CheY-like chemotaxis protein
MIKILLVEDDPYMQKLVSLYLKSHQSSIDMAGNGRIALKKMRQNRYDLLITDLQMPEMDGAALVREVRAAGDLIPVIILSSYDKQQIEEMIREPMVDSLRKPFEGASLIAMINSMMSNGNSVS